MGRRAKSQTLADPEQFAKDTGRALGPLIDGRRKALGLSKRELGDACGVSDATVHNWETGKALPSLVQFRRLCEALYFCADEVFEGAAKP